MSSLRTTVLAAASALVALYAVACAAPVAQKTMVVDCDKTSDDPTCQESTSKKSGSKSSSSSSEEETSSASPSQPETAPSASASSSASAAPTGSGSSTPPGLGFYCAKLDGCCKALDVMGINGSAMLCRDVVSTKNETSCNFAFRDYGKPVINDDGVQTYTPPPACL